MINDIKKDYDEKTGMIRWYKNGILHRENGPAIIRKTNNWYSYAYFINGKLHRENKPAFVISKLSGDGSVKASSEFWYKNGKRYYSKLYNGLTYNN